MFPLPTKRKSKCVALRKMALAKRLCAWLRHKCLFPMMQRKGTAAGLCIDRAQHESIRWGRLYRRLDGADDDNAGVAEKTSGGKHLYQ